MASSKSDGVTHLLIRARIEAGFEAWPAYLTRSLLRRRISAFWREISRSGIAGLEKLGAFVKRNLS
ncbi:MAG: hypothetical protein JRS35_10805 [Deltaproteobacteria bacterium]|nr:hypothetical protein [Deltaproteobacteria bacterium]